MHKCIETPDDEKLAPSAEDEKVIDLFNDKVRKSEDKHFILPIPFRDPNVKIPNNRSMAESRLASLRRQLRKDPDLRLFYTQKMRENINTGFFKKRDPHRKVVAFSGAGQKLWVE